MRLSRLRLVGFMLGGVVGPIAAFGAAPALAALPPGYQVQRIDSPIPAATGGFGNLMAPIGDVNGDGKEDFAAIQYVGSLNLNTLTTTNGDGIIWEFSGATGQGRVEIRYLSDGKLPRRATAAGTAGVIFRGSIQTNGVTNVLR